MPIIYVTNGLYANSKDIVQMFSEKFNCSIITDADIIEKTHQTSKIKKATLQKVLESKQIAFNDFTHDKEKSIILCADNFDSFHFDLWNDKSVDKFKFPRKI